MNDTNIMRLALAIALSLGALHLAPGAALAQDAEDEASSDDADEEARVHFRLGTAYYESGRFAEAAREYQLSYDLSNRPGLLYNIFLAWRDASELAPAVEALRAYLELGEVPSDARVRLEAQLEGMERRLERQQATGTTTTTQTQTQTQTQTTETESETTEEEDEGDTSTEVEDGGEEVVVADDAGGGGVPLVPIIVMAGGGALVVASIITGVMALGKKGDLDDMCDDTGACDPGFEDARDSGQSLAIVTDVLLFGGLATVAVGAVLLALGVGGSDDEEDPSLSFGCTGDGCAASAHVRF